MAHQLNFFTRDSEADQLREELKRVRLSSDKVRKGLFARHNELAKMYLDMKEEFESWKKIICEGKGK